MINPKKTRIFGIFPKRKHCTIVSFVQCGYGWSSWIRTSGMTESKSDFYCAKSLFYAVLNVCKCLKMIAVADFVADFLHVVNGISQICNVIQMCVFISHIGATMSQNC